MSDLRKFEDEAGRLAKSSLEKVAVLGLGGCGCDIVASLAESGVKGPKLICANSDAQSLDRSPVPDKILLGPKHAGGRGCGGDAELGAKAAMESMDGILEAVKGAQIAFIVAGLGGGTGAGAAPVVAKTLSELDDPPLLAMLAVMPLGFETGRIQHGASILAKLSRCCKIVIPIHSERLVRFSPQLTLSEFRKLVDDALARAVTSVTDLIEAFEGGGLEMMDVRLALSHPGRAVMGFGDGAGEDRVQKALNMAFTSPMMADVSLAEAKAVLVNITSDADILMREANSINQAIGGLVGDKCEYLWGLVLSDSLKGSGMLKLTILATGLEPDVF